MFLKADVLITRVRDSNANLVEQMDKNEQTKAALQKLCHALRTQITLTKEEGELKVNITCLDIHTLLSKNKLSAFIWNGRYSKSS